MAATRAHPDHGHWHRRARPLLGTLVEIGVAAQSPAAEAACNAAYAVIAEVQSCLSRFEAESDIARFNAAPAHTWRPVRAHTRAVLAAAHELHQASAGWFDISQGNPQGWQCDARGLHKHASDVRLDLGGIAKGYAVDCAVQTLIAHGCTDGWVNAGGDLRAFGAVELPLALRDETSGGTRRIGHLADGAFATSHFAPSSRSQLHVPAGHRTHAHVSVAAPCCLWADALTKIVAISKDAAHPLLADLGAQAWLH